MQAVFDAAQATELFAVEGVFLNVDGHEHFVHVFANLLEGRSERQKADLFAGVVLALKSLLPAVEILSMNVREFERATYRNALLV